MHTIHRRRRHFALSALAVGAVLAAPAWAQSAGAETLSISAPYPAGGSSDAVARILLPGMAKSLGKTILASENFAHQLGLDLTQVPYRGGAPTVQDLGGSVVDLMFGPMIPQYAQMVEAGRMKAIGIAAAQRAATLPKVQAYGEVPALKDNCFTAWAGIFVPAGTHNELAARIAKAAHEGAATPEFQNMLKLSGNAAGPVLTLEQAAAFYKSETERYEQIAKAVKLEAD